MLFISQLGRAKGKNESTHVCSEDKIRETQEIAEREREDQLIELIVKIQYHIRKKRRRPVPDTLKLLILRIYYTDSSNIWTAV